MASGSGSLGWKRTSLDSRITAIGELENADIPLCYERLVDGRRRNAEKPGSLGLPFCSNEFVEGGLAHDRASVGHTSGY